MRLLFVLAIGSLFSITSCQKDDSFENQENASSRIGAIECIDFETPVWNAGDIPNQLFTNLGSGPFGVFGYNDNFVGTNAAMIFDSSNPTGNDVDLGSPND